jgi:tRNA modification GTPase
VEPEELGQCIDALIERVEALLGDATRGRMIREGVTAVIAGRPNVGKSSVFNALAGIDRAIVTSIPGTTRDLVTERVDIDGLSVTLVDTAGSRETTDLIEREGVARGSHARDVADVVLLVLDVSEPLTGDDERLLEQTRGAQRVVVANKRDLPNAWDRAPSGNAVLETGIGASPVLFVSATTGEGIVALRQAVVTVLTGRESLRDAAGISNVRHISLLEEARAHLRAAYEAGRTGTMPEEFVLTDLQAAQRRFEEIVGRRTTDDVLRHVFERFCIGK